jgi:DNA-binding NarL/FixJ family response regulator
MTLLDRLHADGASAAPAMTPVGIVDAHALLVEGLSATLGRPGTGLEVVAATDRWHELLEHPAYPPEVVVLDHDLEGELSSTARIGALTAAGARVVVLARRAEPALVHAAFQAGALGFVPKTHDTDTLCRAIRSVAAGRQWLDPSLRADLDAFDVSEEPGLGDRERRALLLYASGRTLRDVAEAMNTTEETVKSYIKRARRKYRAVGIDLGTRALLRRHAARQGWIPAD